MYLYYSSINRLVKKVIKECILFGLVGAIFIPACAGAPPHPPNNSAAVTATAPAGSDKPESALPGEVEPRSITSLSEISTHSALQMPTQPPVTTTSAPADPNAVVQQNIERLVVAQASQARYREGPAPAAATTTLLNDKARTYSEFSFQLLNQVLAAARSIESDRLHSRKLPDNIGSTVLTGVMDHEGRLTEISIEAHSGDHQLDTIIIDACKRGLWSRNPPAGAIGADGMYRVRLRAQIRAVSFDRYGQYHYQTELGLALL
jgi:hypothetical protein